MNDNGGKTGKPVVETVPQTVVQEVVEQLKRDGYDVEFRHYRRYSTEGYGEAQYSRKTGWVKQEVELGDPLARGGASECHIVYKDGDELKVWVMGLGVCHPTEQFCYTIGRQVALADAIRDGVEFEELDPEVYNPLRGKLWAECSKYWKARKMKTCLSQS